MSETEEEKAVSSADWDAVWTTLLPEAVSALSASNLITLGWLLGLAEKSKMEMERL